MRVETATCQVADRNSTARSGCRAVQHTSMLLTWGARSRGLQRNRLHNLAASMSPQCHKCPTAGNGAWCCICWPYNATELARLSKTLTVETLDAGDQLYSLIKSTRHSRRRARDRRCGGLLSCYNHYVRKFELLTLPATHVCCRTSHVQIHSSGCRPAGRPGLRWAVRHSFMLWCSYGVIAHAIGADLSSSRQPMTGPRCKTHSVFGCACTVHMVAAYTW